MIVRNTGPSSRPMLWLGIAFTAGIAAGKVIGGDARVVLPAVVCLAVGAVLARRVSSGLVIAAFFAAGWMSICSAEQSVGADRVRSLIDRGVLDSGQPIMIDGWVTGGIEDGFGWLRFDIETEALSARGVSRRVTGRVRVTAAVSDETALSDYARLGIGHGDRLRLACPIRREEAFRNAGVVSRTAVLDDRGDDAVCTVKSPLLIEKVAPGSRYSPAAIVHRMRQALVAEFRSAFGTSTAGVMIASMLGNKNFLDRRTADVFREGGTFHVLVISGLHITFIGGLLLAAVRVVTRRRPVQFAVTVGALWAYAVAVGGEIPVVRAALMFTILLTADVIYRPRDPLNALGLTALVLLAWRPADLFSPSFQLTFLSVAAIIGLALPLLENLRRIGEWHPTAETPFPPRTAPPVRSFCEWMYWRPEEYRSDQRRRIWSAGLYKPDSGGGTGRLAARYLFEGLAVSVVVQIVLLPASAVYFHRVSVSGVFLNLWVGFVLALESIAAVAAVAVRQFSETAGVPLVLLTEILNAALVSVPEGLLAGGFGGMRPAVYDGPGGAVYALYFVPVLAAVIAANSWNPFSARRGRPFRWRAWAACWLLLGGAVVLHPLSAPGHDGRLTIDFLDVGQGDSALVTFPNGTTMLVDGGGRPAYGTNPVGDDDREPFDPDTFDIGESVVSEFLWEMGLTSVDYLVATHADADHVQGLAAVAANFRIGMALAGRRPAGDVDFDRFAAALAAGGVPLVPTGHGDRLEIGGAVVDVLHPEKDGSPEALGGNDNSLVLRIRFGSRTLLLTGDIEAGAERKLASSGEPLRADVVKVAHHGSRTSSRSEFVDAVRPPVAVISVGRESRFGHPHPEVVTRWTESGARVLTTGQNGTVTVSTDGADLVLSVFSGRGPR